MKTANKTISFTPEKQFEYINLTEDIKKFVEESGIKNVVLTGLLGVYQINGAIGVVFLGTTDEDVDLKSIKSEEISSAGWYDPKEVATGDYTLRPPLKHVLEDYLAGKKYPLDLVRYSLEN